MTDKHIQHQDPGRSHTEEDSRSPPTGQLVAHRRRPAAHRARHPKRAFGGRRVEERRWRPSTRRRSRSWPRLDWKSGIGRLNYSAMPDQGLGTGIRDRRGVRAGVARRSRRLARMGGPGPTTATAQSSHDRGSGRPHAGIGSASSCGCPLKAMRSRPRRWCWPAFLGGDDGVGTTDTSRGDDTPRRKQS